MPHTLLHSNTLMEGEERCRYCAKPRFRQSPDEPCDGPLPLRRALEAIDMQSLWAWVERTAQQISVRSDPCSPPKTAWLIERGATIGHTPTIWWCGGDQRAGVGEDEMKNWTDDANKARQFGTRAEAAELARWLFAPGRFCITEHLFGTAPPAPPAVAPGCQSFSDANPMQNNEDLETARLAVRREGEISEAFHQSAAFTLDLTLTCLTTDGVPEDVRRRAYATHRKLLQYRDKYTLRSLGEVERGQHDLAIDAPNAEAFGARVAPTKPEANSWYDEQPPETQDRLRHEWERRAGQYVTGRLGYRPYSDIQHEVIAEAMFTFSPTKADVAAMEKPVRCPKCGQQMGRQTVPNDGSWHCGSIRCGYEVTPNSPIEEVREFLRVNNIDSTEAVAAVFWKLVGLGILPKDDPRPPSPPKRQPEFA